VTEWIDKLGPATALKLRCAGCGSRWDAADPDEFSRSLDAGCCSVCGSFDLEPAYDVGPACGGCGRRGPWEKVLDYCCSRACTLQAEYKATLEAR
jgi:hypothetical protein